MKTKHHLIIRSSKGYNVEPYLAGCCQCGLWILYWLPRTDGIPFYAVNAMGVILQSVFVWMFIFFLDDFRSKLVAISKVLVVCGVWAGCAFMDKGILGRVCSGVNTIFLRSHCSTLLKLYDAGCTQKNA